jgi:hypothetical protein
LPIADRRNKTGSNCYPVLFLILAKALFNVLFDLCLSYGEAYWGAFFIPGILPGDTKMIRSDKPAIKPWFAPIKPLRNRSQCLTVKPDDITIGMPAFPVDSKG